MVIAKILCGQCHFLFLLINSIVRTNLISILHRPVAYRYTINIHFTNRFCYNVILGNEIKLLRAILFVKFGYNITIIC